MWRCACAVALLCAAFADAEAFKRAEMSASPFVLSSRYGRSSPRMLSPRNDRFFLTGRYGKRSGAESERVALKMFENANRSDRDRQRERSTEKDRDRERVLHKWRPRCNCARYAKALSLGNYYKRTPEILDSTFGQH